jgi:hypothetical protein
MREERESTMRPIKWFVGAAIGAMLLAPGFAKADLQYVYVSGNFAVTSNSISGTESVKLTDTNGNSISPGAGPIYTLTVAGVGAGNIHGSLLDKASNKMFDFSGGTVSIFNTNGSNAVFTVSGIHYTNVWNVVNMNPITSYIPLNSSGSFTGSTTAWNGMTGKFNGQFSASTPELGSSVAMATMLLGAGFLGFRKRR